MGYLRERSGSFKEITGEQFQAKRLATYLDLQEHEFLVKIVAECSLPEIETAMKMTESQIAALRNGVLQKFNATTTADLVRIGIYAGLKS